MTLMIKKIKVPAGSAVLCPVCLDVGLGDFLVVPGVHQLSDTLLMRTPVFFAREEEDNLRKMLDAGVIQPSLSE